jgi:hypothetical protein
MAVDEFNKIDIGYVKMCVQANIHNALTSYFYLLARKMVIEGEQLEISGLNTKPGPLVPNEKQVKKY